MSYPCMLDLETLGTAPNSVIIAIGAVKFDLDGVKDQFYQVVDPASCVDIGLQIDASTVMWWMQQNTAARKAFTEKGVHIEVALSQFASWVDENDLVWGNGSDFDNVLLAEAYKKAKIEQPWKYFNNRCYRTMKNQFPQIKLERKGTHHNAVDDAISQAEHLIKILNHIRGV